MPWCEQVTRPTLEQCISKETLPAFITVGSPIDKAVPCKVRPLIVLSLLDTKAGVYSSIYAFQYCQILSFND